MDDNLTQGHGVAGLRRLLQWFAQLLKAIPFPDQRIHA
jgi:hypothetical protein